VISSIQPRRQGRAVPRQILLRDCDPVSKPSHPPAERAQRDNGVVAQRRNCQVNDWRMPTRVDDLSSSYVRPTPDRIITDHHEQDSRQTVGEEGHRTVKIVGGRHRPAVSLVLPAIVVGPAYVDHDANECGVLPLAGRLGLYPAPRLSLDVRPERQVDSQLVFDAPEVLVRGEDAVDRHVSRRKVLELVVVDSGAACRQIQRSCCRILRRKRIFRQPLA